MWLQLGALLIAPLLYWQGLSAKRHTPVLPEPPGERVGVSGEGKCLRLLIIGDSAAAGVGAAHQADALLGQLVSILAGSYRIHWQLHAKTGATTLDILDSLAELTPNSFDVVIISLGVNDVTRGVSLHRWQAQQRQLVSRLTQDFSAKLLLHSALPPIHKFPALAQPLRWFLGQRARQLDDRLANRICRSPHSQYLILPFDLADDSLASDGFHPGPGIYQRWAERAAEMVKAHF